MNGATVALVLRRASEELWEAAGGGGDIADVVSEMALLLDHHAELVTALVDARSAAGGSSAVEVDRVVHAFGPAMRVLLHEDSLREFFPGLVDICDLRSSGSPSVADWLLFARAIQAFVHGQTGDLALTDDLWLVRIYSLDFDADIGDLTLSGVTVEHFEQCVLDPSAAVYGDNPGCDAYLGACVGGDGDACNDLYWISSAGTAYESFAASCADRVGVSSLEYAGRCEDVTT